MQLAGKNDLALQEATGIVSMLQQNRPGVTGIIAGMVLCQPSS